ncbi:MAG TPA: right-handed parallel beta-helix repeat-containing protein [Acidimicrobiia bacterium]|jgi:parallel beta-helix repeat protein
MVRSTQLRNRRLRRHAWCNTRRRAIAVVGTLAVLGASGATWLANSSSASAPRVDDAHVATPYVTPSVSDSDYSIPAGAIFVAPSSSAADGAASAQVAAAHANGSVSAPYPSLAQAVKHSRNGSTIVLRGGTYRGTLGTISHRVTIQAYPHQQVWVNGAAVLANLKHVGNAWVRTGWDPHVCHNCYPRNALDPQYPYAGLGDQVFIDGRPQAEVGSVGKVRAGTFYVDHRAGRLYVGSNPNGHHVEATMYEKALQFSGRAAGSVVRGIGFEHFAPHYNMDVPAMVVAAAPNVTFDHDTFALSAGRGLSVFRSGTAITNSAFLDNGLNGFHANTADGLEFTNNRVIGSNFSHWSIASTASASIAGAKITSTSNGIVRGNLFAANDSNGIWLDVSSSHFDVTDNNVIGSGGMGIAIELSGYVIVAGNVSSGNARIGIKVSGSNNVSVWDNTVANNGQSQIGVYQDPRSTSRPRDGATWNTTQVTIVNNVIIGRTGATKSVLDSFNGRRGARITTARMVSFDDRNVWGRPVPSSPRFMASWQNSASKSAFTSLAAIQQGTGRERHSVSADHDTLGSMFVSATNGDYRLTNRNAAMVQGTAVPQSIAAAMDVRAGVPPHLGALLVPAI